MKVDLSCEDLFIVTQDESQVHFGYKDEKLVTLVFNSPEDASEFYETRSFLNPRSPFYKSALSGVVVKSVFVKNLGKKE